MTPRNHISDPVGWVALCDSKHSPKNDLVVLFKDKFQFHRLLAELEAAAERGPLPELPAGRVELNSLLLALRAREEIEG